MTKTFQLPGYYISLVHPFYKDSTPYRLPNVEVPEGYSIICNDNGVLIFETHSAAEEYAQDHELCNYDVKKKDITFTIEQ